MNAVPAEESFVDAGADGVIVFTSRGEAALDELATVLTAQCTNTPAGIAHVLDQVLHADLAQLGGALTAIATASEPRVQPPEDPDVPAADIPEAAAQRPLGRRSEPSRSAAAQRSGVDR